MILSPSSAIVDPMSAFMSSSSKTLKTPKPSLKTENADAKPSFQANSVERALNDLSLKQNISKVSQHAVVSPSRALQPLDVNLSKASRQEASSSRSPPSSSSPSPKLCSSRSSTKKVRSPSSKDHTTSSRAVKKALKLVHSSVMLTPTR